MRGQGPPGSLFPVMSIEHYTDRCNKFISQEHLCKTVQPYENIVLSEHLIIAYPKVVPFWEMNITTPSFFPIAI